MADEIWAITSPAAKTLTFSIAGHLIDDMEYLKFNQIQDVTIGGIRMVKNLGENLNQWEYSCIVPKSSTAVTDYTDVMDFIGSTYANGGVNSFTWTDYEATPRIVKILNDNVSVKTMGAYKLFSFILEEDNA